MWNPSPTIRNRKYTDRGCDDGGWDNLELWPNEDEFQSPPIEPLTPPPPPPPPTTAVPTARQPPPPPTPTTTTLNNALSSFNHHATPVTTKTTPIINILPMKYDATHRQPKRQQPVLDHVGITFLCDTNKRTNFIIGNLSGKHAGSHIFNDARVEPCSKTNNRDLTSDHTHLANNPSLGCKDETSTPRKMIKIDLPNQLDANHPKQTITFRNVSYARHAEPRASSLKSIGQDHNKNLYQKKNVSFRSVVVYYFTRSQGFISIPTEGGSTLGMCTHHFMSQELNLETHEELRQKMHREILLRLRHAKARRKEYDSSSNSEDDFNENDYCDISNSDLNLDKFIFLRPISIKNRRSLLRSAGIAKIDATEKRECKRIRDSRERAGCRCDGICNPATCECSRLGVNCHVDRESFPCGCSSSGCRNPSGRLEFDGKRVRNHFIDTLLRLGFGANLKTKDLNLLRERQILHNGNIKCLNDRGQSNFLEYINGLKGLEQQGGNVEVESIEDIPETSYSFYDYELSQLQTQESNNVMCTRPMELENHNYVKKIISGYTTSDSQTNCLAGTINSSLPKQIQDTQSEGLGTNLQSNIRVPAIVRTTHLDHPYMSLVSGYTDAHPNHLSYEQQLSTGDFNCDTITIHPSSSGYNINDSLPQTSICVNDQRYCAAVQSLCDHRYFTTNNKKVMLVNNNHLNSQNIDEYNKHIATREGD